MLSESSLFIKVTMIFIGAVITNFSLQKLSFWNSTLTLYFNSIRN